MSKKIYETQLDMSAEIKPLIHKLGISIGEEVNGSIVTFIAARSGEGTSTAARSFVRAFNEETGRKALLIEGNADENISGKGIVELAASGADILAGLTDKGGGVFTGKWIASAQGKHMSGRIVQDRSFWQSLQSHFDVIVIDAPALQRSADGIAFAQASTMTVLVVEAESTRKEVVENLRETLTAANAKIAGIVMSNRKFYIPEKVYNRL